ncbi:hypothetical protein EGW08_005673 [Elysia chlorotica]|uniref:Rho-GAP domain-containing protein n=1 Tax=Elysia chlorotica TaxID=188477 RepID=A0A3S1AA47_ELYCH|nr:hypothetical protein EGW08_005673 [Elysia chlorotica]
MDGPTLINSIGRIDRLHSLIRHDLRDLGIKLPKSKKVKKQNQSRRSISLSSQHPQEGVIGNKIFGQPLSQIPCVFLDQYGYVPQFLISTSEFIINHSESEGIFRKSGSLGRQKELRVAVEDGKPFEDANIHDVTSLVAVEDGKPFEDANIHDVTSLVKQFFRELPEPLIIPIYHDAFIKSFQMPAEKDPKDALLRLCLLLPLENVGTLRYTMHLLQRVAQRCDKNKMTCNNLALVVAPNLMGGGAGWKTGQKMTQAEEKVLHAQTCIVELLIRHWDQVAMVPGPLRQQLSMMSECFGTDDELDVSDDNTLDEGKETVRKKKRRRSGSLTGIVSSIAQGIAKLRRSTDGKSINMSSNSTFRGELSLASDSSQLSQTQDYSSMSDATPYIMRKRRASGDNGPFTSSKKPSSASERLESPPAKPGKGKNVFRRKSGSRDKLRHDDSVRRQEETSLCEKNPSPKSAVSDSAINEAGRKKEPFRSLSSSSLQDSSESSLVVVDDETDGSMDSVFSAPEQKHDALTKDSVRFSRARSQSADSPVTRRGQPTALSSGLKRDAAPKVRGRLDKSQISEPSPLVVPVVANAVHCGTDGELRRSRRDEFESQQRRLRETLPKDRRDQRERNVRMRSQTPDRLDGGGVTTAHVPLLPLPDSDLDKSFASQLDSSLMEAVLPPPHGFGDQTMLEEDVFEIDAEGKECHAESPQEEEIDVDSDVLSEAGFSTISGGTVMQRTDSGHYKCPDLISVSGSSLVSSAMGRKSARPLSMPIPFSRKDLGNTSTALAGDNSRSAQNLLFSCSTDDKPRETMRSTNEEEDPYVVLRADASSNVIPEGDYVILKPKKQRSSKGMKLLCENYHSSEEESSSSATNLKQDLNITIGSHQDDLDKMPTQADVTKRKSFSAEDLQTRARLPAPSRAQSLYMSPCRRFNYKPYLEISRETHTILARAGYLEPSAPTDKSKDVQVPVKSPTRSNYREEMKSILRSSFHERHSRLSASLRSNRSRSSMDASLANLTCSSSNTSISSECEKLSISSQNDIKSASGDATMKANSGMAPNVVPVVSELMQKVEEISAILEAPNKKTVLDSNEEEERNENANCLSNSDISHENCSESKIDIIKADGGNQTKSNFLEKSATLQHDQTKSLQESDKKLTLSGFLDQVQIKRAEMLMPKHDSILDVKQAGIVAQSVRHFSQNQSFDEGNRSISNGTQRRGNQALRIPTIFAKNEEKLKYYRDITSLARERTGGDGPKLSDTAQTIDTIGEYTEDDAGSETSETEDGNVTVVEVPNFEAQKTELNASEKDVSPGIDASSVTEENIISKDFSSCSRPKTHSSEPAFNSDALSPKKSSLQCPQVPKSPLLESTNTASTAPKLGRDFSEALALCAGSDDVLNSLASRNKPQLRPFTPGSRAYSRNQLKRLKATSSSRKQTLSSPVAAVESPRSGDDVHDDEGSNSDPQHSSLYTATVTGDNL